MTNPYEPPSHSIDRIENPEYLPITLQRRLIHAVFFSAGSVFGLNAGVAADEGVSSTIQRTTIDPGSAIAFFTCVAIVCVAVTGTWKAIRSRLLSNFRTTNSVSFATGFSITFASYLATLYAERSGLDTVGSMIVTLVGTTTIVVELEAAVIRLWPALSK